MKTNIRKLIMMTVLIGVLSPLIFLSRTSVAQGDTWTPTGSMVETRRDHTATLLENGRVLIAGWSENAELYDPVTGTFSFAGETLFNHFQGSTATRLLDGRVLIVGGNGDQTSAEIYDPATETFTQTGSLNEVHSYHTATRLPDGRVLIAAGQDSTGPQSHAVAELYDPETGTFSLTGSMNQHRSGHRAVLLSDGQVLIMGGHRTTTPGFGLVLNSAELYDPETGSFSPTGSMNQYRTGHAAVLLSDGRVLVAGSTSGVPIAELYDPETSTFSPTGSMSEQRRNHTATLLSDGRVLLVGGIVGVGPLTTSSADLFDPATEIFTATASMTSARHSHTATLLLNGQVLVTGGNNPVDPNLSSAELFAPLTVAIDIKSYNINPRSKGVIPVAIFTTDTFDATNVDPLSVVFGPNRAMAIHGIGHIEDVDGDGYDDLMLHFNTQNTGIECGFTSVSLTGETFGGQAIEGSDSINTVGCR